MLFIDPAARGAGVGRSLIEFVLNSLQVQRVDVNEPNLQAIGFYEKMGFQVEGRSELDGSGRPYPTLHLRQKGIESKSIFRTGAQNSSSLDF
ncbi:MAG: GNAT family N-acetyltransferase [Polaromonas sp.]|nr:GNAT family N-acetyltransferase [Polaromonas sp.]